MKQRGQFAVGQRPDGGIIGILQGFQASREVAGKHLRAEDVAVARIRAERLLHEVVRVARGIQFLKPGLAQDIGGEGPRLGDAAALSMMVWMPREGSRRLMLGMAVLLCR